MSIKNGTAGNDRYEGRGGADSFSGAGGNDTLIGGGGNDVLNGGRDNDTLDGGSGRDTLFAGDGYDQLTGGTNADIFNISLGDGRTASHTTITDFSSRQGDELNIRLRTSDPNVKVELVDNERGNLEIRAGEAVVELQDQKAATFDADRLNLQVSTPGDDRLEGGKSGDMLDGGAGADVLTGGRGRDTLFGGDGNDELTGGADADKFAVLFGGPDEPGSRTTIKDFNFAEGDRLVLGRPANAEGMFMEWEDNAKGNLEIRLGESVVEFEDVSINDFDGHMNEVMIREF